LQCQTDIQVFNENSRDLRWETRANSIDWPPTPSQSIRKDTSRTLATGSELPLPKHRQHCYSNAQSDLQKRKRNKLENLQELVDLIGGTVMIIEMQAAKSENVDHSRWCSEMSSEERDGHRGCRIDQVLHLQSVVIFLPRASSGWLSRDNRKTITSDSEFVFRLSLI
jgi:hypothetical protein